MTLHRRARILAAAAAGLLAIVALAAPAAAETGVSDGKTYSITMTSIEGSTDDHLGNWDAKIDELSGGDPAVVQAVNAAGRTAAQARIDHMNGVAAPGLEWNLDVRGEVTFRSIAIGQLVIATSYYGAVPTVTPTAVVIDSRTAKPITVADLFTD